MRRSLQMAGGLLAVSTLFIVQSPAPMATAGPDGGHRETATTIRYTEHGIPHITADDFTGLGYGYGYAVAKDNLCVLANSYVTVRVVMMLLPKSPCTVWSR